MCAGLKYKSKAIIDRDKKQIYNTLYLNVSIGLMSEIKIPFCIQDKNPNICLFFFFLKFIIYIYVQAKIVNNDCPCFFHSIDAQVSKRLISPFLI
jgi:hypothetical protein